jgi:hypothetical protein
MAENSHYGDKSIENTPSHHDSHNESLEGSPLKLQSFHVDYQLVKHRKRTHSNVEKPVYIPGDPLDNNLAR